MWTCSRRGLFSKALGQTLTTFLYIPILLSFLISKRTLLGSTHCPSIPLVCHFLHQSRPHNDKDRNGETVPKPVYSYAVYLGESSIPNIVTGTTCGDDRAVKIDYHIISWDWSNI